MITDSSIEIAAPLACVWNVFADVARWPEWTESVTSIEALDGAELAVGRRFAIKQPRFPRLVWTVTALDPGTSWSWEQRSPGGSTVASHELVAVNDGRTLVRQRIDQTGPVGVVVGLLTRGLTRRYLDLEAKGLRAASEARAAAT